MRSGYFNSELIGYDSENMPVFDRAEEASFFAKYFSQFISNGVFPNPSTNMQILAVQDMKIKVDIGCCYINGYMGWVETAEIFEIEESDLQSRIDRIVARLDFTDRSIKLFVKKGEALGNPVAPALQRDYDIYEIGLADILVNANAIEITQEKITDLRLNTELCGIVANQLQHVDTTTLFNQYQEWLKRVTGEAEINLSNMQTEFEQEFNNWFQTVQSILDEDTAGHLLNLINTKADKKKTWAITADTIWTETQVYDLTEDTVLDNNKTYYTRSGNEGAYIYTEVTNPVVANIATYYEKTLQPPYTKTITATGILATDEPKLYPVYSETLATRVTEKEEYAKISMIKAVANAVELTCDEDKPTVALNLRVEVDY